MDAGIAQQARDALRIRDARAALRDDGRQRAPQIARRIALSAPDSYSVTKDLSDPAKRSVRCFDAPRGSIAASFLSSSGAPLLRGGLVPIHGNTSTAAIRPY